MYISFSKYVSSIPGVYYQGFDGIADIYGKNNIHNIDGVIVPADHYDATVYKAFIDAMIEFKEKPNGIVSYLARSNNLDTTYTVTLFASMEDFLSIAQTSWFEDFTAKRAAYLKLTGIQPYLRNIESLPALITIDTTFDMLALLWDQQEVFIA
jgi:hypothetical protein